MPGEGGEREEGGVGWVLRERWRVDGRGGGANCSRGRERRVYGCSVGRGMGCGIGSVGVGVVDGGRVRLWAVEHTAGVTAVGIMVVVGRGCVLERGRGVGSTLGERRGREGGVEDRGEWGREGTQLTQRALQSHLLADEYVGVLGCYPYSTTFRSRGWSRVGYPALSVCNATSSG